MCGWGADVGSSGDDGDPWRSSSEGREGQHRGHGSLWLHKHTQYIMSTVHDVSLSQFYPGCLLTGGLGRFFLLVVDLEPENRLFRAASAALALATFLLGPVPRKTCLSTSTCHTTHRLILCSWILGGQVNRKHYLWILYESNINTKHLQVKDFYT